jgi:hypothetical protein
MPRSLTFSARLTPDAGRRATGRRLRWHALPATASGMTVRFTLIVITLGARTVDLLIIVMGADRNLA